LIQRTEACLKEPGGEQAGTCF